VTLFEANTHAEAVVLAPQQDIWDVLVDPDLIARFTPFVKRITADGEHWRWEMGGLEVLGKSVAPAFTERMVLKEPDRIEFHHDPPEGVKEKSWVEGWYDLSPVPESEGSGTALVTDLTISLDLPLPGVARPAVKATMRKVIDTMGDRFSANLLEHLGTTQQ
jgi:carbon monoxide dehydrogenase subunit G